MKKLISVILFINFFFITSLLSSEIINPKILKVALLPDENAARLIKKHQKFKDYLENKLNKKNDILVFVDSKKSIVKKKLKKRTNFNSKIYNKFKKIQFSSSYKKKKSNYIIKNKFREKGVKSEIKNILHKIL